MIEYICLDARRTSLASEVEKLQDLKSQGYYILGLEVTVPDLAKECNENIDPQHTDKRSDIACIQEVFERCQLNEIFPLPLPKKLALATVRADLDSIGSMALIRTYLQADSHWMRFTQPRDRIKLIVDADCFVNSGVWHPQKVFDSGFRQSQLAAIALAVADFKIPLKDRIQWVSDWIDTGVEPYGYRHIYESDRLKIQEALESGETIVELKDKIAIVRSKLRTATSIGYMYAPVVIAFNPEFQLPTGVCSKFTICQYTPDYCNLDAAIQELAKLEPGWGGSPVIGGSPQGVSSVLTVEQVWGIVNKHCRIV